MQIKSMQKGRNDWAAGINIELLDSPNRTLSGTRLSKSTRRHEFQIIGVNLGTLTYYILYWKSKWRGEILRGFNSCVVFRQFTASRVFFDDIFQGRHASTKLFPRTPPKISRRNFFTIVAHMLFTKLMDALFSSYTNLGSKLPKNDATITRKKDDATVKNSFKSTKKVVKASALYLTFKPIIPTFLKNDPLNWLGILTCFFVLTINNHFKPK